MLWATLAVFCRLLEKPIVCDGFMVIDYLGMTAINNHQDAQGRSVSRAEETSPTPWMLAYASFLQLGPNGARHPET